MNNYLNEITPGLQNEAMSLKDQASIATGTFNTGGMKSVNPNIKDSGAAVPFTPKATKTINSVFGTPIANSYDRAINTIDTMPNQGL